MCLPFTFSLINDTFNLFINSSVPLESFTTGSHRAQFLSWAVLCDLINKTSTAPNSAGIGEIQTQHGLDQVYYFFFFFFRLKTSGKTWNWKTFGISIMTAMQKGWNWAVLESKKYNFLNVRHWAWRIVETGNVTTGFCNEAAVCFSKGLPAFSWKKFTFFFKNWNKFSLQVSILLTQNLHKHQSWAFLCPKMWWRSREEPNCHLWAVPLLS